MSQINRAYCDKKCEIGTKQSEKFLKENNSAFDAAMDFVFFTDECFKTCPYKEQHLNKIKEG